MNMKTCLLSLAPYARVLQRTMPQESGQGKFPQQLCNIKTQSSLPCHQIKASKQIIIPFLSPPLPCSWAVRVTPYSRPLQEQSIYVPVHPCTRPSMYPSVHSGLPASTLFRSMLSFPLESTIPYKHSSNRLKPLRPSTKLCVSLFITMPLPMLR